MKLENTLACLILEPFRAKKFVANRIIDHFIQHLKLNLTPKLFFSVKIREQILWSNLFIGADVILNIQGINLYAFRNGV